LVIFRTEIVPSKKCLGLPLTMLYTKS